MVGRVGSIAGLRSYGGNVNKQYWVLVGKKILETAISVKVLTIAALMTVSTMALWSGKMTGGEWGAVNGGVIATVYALREAFKVARLKNGDNNGKEDPEHTKSKSFII